MAEITSNDKTVVVAGGGVAGIEAALSLAAAGTRVHLVERTAFPGGQVMNLDKLYPTDHCAFCPLWTEVRQLRRHPLISLHTSSRLGALGEEGGRLRVPIETAPPPIDAERCIFCGRCAAACGQDAIAAAGAHVYAPFYQIDAARCDDCGACVSVCPTAAIDLARPPRTVVVAADDIVWATGFADGDIRPLEEYGYGTHADIMTSLEFEDWIGEAGRNQGAVQTHAGRVPQAIAFIQCAGARDQRLFPYCSAVCCMHALKQARWVKRRYPQIECTIFYTDLRDSGRHYYEYYHRESGAAALELVRGRPGMIHPIKGQAGIAVRYEDTLAQQRHLRRFDMVVLNGALQPSLAQDENALPSLDDEGFVAGKPLACGFCREPGDVELSVVQAAAAALAVCLGGEHEG